MEVCDEADMTSSYVTEGFLGFFEVVLDFPKSKTFGKLFCLFLFVFSKFFVSWVSLKK